MTNKIVFLMIAAFLIGLASFPLVYMLLTGDFPGSRIFYGIQEDDAIVNFLLTIHGK
jgi:hypothetical protein